MLLCGAVINAFSVEHHSAVGLHSANIRKQLLADGSPDIHRGCDRRDDECMKAIR